MERIFWVSSIRKGLGSKEDDGLAEVRAHLENGWKVKMISACAAGDNAAMAQAYVVLEREKD